jgi:DNA-binding beta-propeller fold protein YncE
MRTDTIYVANDTGSVSVVDGAHCDATVTVGCDKPLATIHVGGFPVDAVFNPMTSTLYVASPAGEVFVINGAKCNAMTIRGCGQPVKTVTDSAGPQAVDVDVATDTVYAVNNDGGNGDTVSVIDGATCNGSDGTGCGLAPRTITVGSGAFWDAVDQATDTVYVTNNNDGTVSVIDGARCNATITSGCASTPLAVPTGAAAAGVAVDDSLHTAFVINQNDDTLSALNTRTCNGVSTSGCPDPAPNAQAGSNHNPRYARAPNSVTLMPQTDTGYVVSIGGANVLSVVTLTRCNAIDTSGCRIPAPSVPATEFEASIDPRTDTIYASNFNLPEIDVLNGATCDAKHQSGCSPVAEIPVGGSGASLGSIDDTTHTLYAADNSGKVSVIDTAACNATHTAGCSDVPPTITIGTTPGAPEINMATKTLYVGYGANGNLIAVVNAATCNAGIVSGCGQIPGVIIVADGNNAIAVSAKTNTIYAPSVDDGTVSVISGVHCNGTDHSGCGSIAATVTVGSLPFGVAVDDATNTVYVVNNGGDTPGTLSVINGAKCNGTNTTGCPDVMPTVVVGRSPLFVAVDVTTDTVYVTDISSAGVAVLNGSTCNAMVTKGCRRPAPEQAVGSQPWDLAVNDDTNTVYAFCPFGAGSMSIFRGRP